MLCQNVFSNTHIRLDKSNHRAKDRNWTTWPLLLPTTAVAAEGRVNPALPATEVVEFVSAHQGNKKIACTNTAVNIRMFYGDYWF